MKKLRTTTLLSMSFGPSTPIYLIGAVVLLLVVMSEGVHADETTTTTRTPSTAAISRGAVAARTARCVTYGHLMLR